MSIEAMKQALEALEKHKPKISESSLAWITHYQAITALRTAIAEAEKQEPVAWLYWDSWGTMKLSQIMPPPVGAFPVYTTPPAAQPAPVQVSPTDFVDMVLDKENAIGKPIFWAEWPNKEKNT
jgi:hypothetical protein